MDVVTILNVIGGIIIAAIIGAAMSFAAQGRYGVLMLPALAGFATTVIFTALSGFALHALPLSLATVLLSTGWAFAPLDVRADRTRAGVGAALGILLAVILAVLAAFDAYWMLPLGGLAFAVLVMVGHSIFPLPPRVKKWFRRTAPHASHTADAEDGDT